MATENLSKELCTVEGCSAYAKTGGVCLPHYRKMWKNGKTGSYGGTRGNSLTICAWCGSEFKRSRKSNSYCSRSCVYLARGGASTLERSNALLLNGGKVCSKHDCDLAAEIRGFCKTHYSRGLKDGTIARKNKPGEYGRPDAKGTVGICEGCGAEFKRWRRGSKWCSNRCSANNNPVVFAGRARGHQKLRDFAAAQRGDAKPKGKGHRARALRLGVAYEHGIRPIEIFRRDGWICQICGCKTLQRLIGTYEAKTPELDHRIPMILGGGHTRDNVQCACHKCNNTKGGTRSVGQTNMFHLFAASPQTGNS